MKPQKLYEIFTEALCDERIKAELIDLIAGKADEDRLEGQTELFPGTDRSGYKKAKKALTEEEEQTFNEGEAEKFLPTNLRNK